MSYAGREILGYRILTLLGRGGMGEVYKATHISSGRPVAIKVLIHERGVDRFRNEARLQANIDHPNIAKLYDLIDLDGRPALILEFVEGMDLDEYLRNNPMLSFMAKMALFEQITAAIAQLHRLSITHRDIKPSNIKVMPNGMVKLIDFGIAKGVTSPTITASGQTVGTLDYMAPERLNGQNTKQSDIWSLGVMLYEIVTGRHPFKANDEFNTRKAISKGEYLRLEKMPELKLPDQKVSGIIAKCLQISPQKRFADGEELHQAVLRHMKYGSRLSMGSYRPSLRMGGKGRTLAIAVIAGICLVVAGFLIFGSGNSGEGGQAAATARTTSSAAAANDVDLTINTNIAGPSFVVFQDKTRCKIPCTISRPSGTELRIEIVSEGYQAYQTRLQFMKSGSKTFTLRRN